MIELIIGKRGKGKTKVLLDRVNDEIRHANGNIVYLDKNFKHMYELNNKIRLINVMEYPLKNADEFVGFVCGLISQDHDLEQVYIDAFLTIARLEGLDTSVTLKQLNDIGNTYDITFIISLSADRDEVPEAFQSHIVAEL